MNKITHDNSGLSDQETAYIVHPELKQTSRNEIELANVIGEIEGLARAIQLDVLHTRPLKLQRIQAGAFLGKGQREDIAAEIKVLKPNVVIVNHALSPVQQRNLEKNWNVKVIDRTGLILEIFGARAQTKEGRLQVELAALDYQRSRLVRSWTHLERQRGATGFIGGPGETQIELDRRMIGERIVKLKKELESVRRTRELGRKSRDRVPFPVIALVGYTNAGKSTLFNTITDAKVFAEDLLFATLDPTLRRFELPNQQQAILSDTVGFISDLPTHLIEAFSATLEQTVHADVIIHVIDVSRPDWKAQRSDVIKILGDLNIEYETDPRIIEAYNKLDLVDQETFDDFAREVKFSDNKAMISAAEGRGLGILLNKATALIAAKRKHVRYSLSVADGKALSWLYDHAEVLNREDKVDAVVMDVMIEPEDLDKFSSQFVYEADLIEANA